MKKLLSHWLFSSLRTKMLTMFVILTSIPLLSVGLISYEKSFNTISEYSQAASMVAADQLAREIDSLFLETGKLLELENNPAVVQFLISQTNSYHDAKDILLTFASYRDTYTYEGVLNISMINLYGRGISERKGVFSLHQNPLRNPHFRHLLNRPDDILVIPPSEASKLDRLDGFHYTDQQVITMIATVKQKITHEVIGFIVIDLDETILNRFTESFTIGRTGYFLVTDQSGTPIFYPPNSSLSPLIEPFAGRLSSQQDSFVYREQGKPMFVVYTTSVQTGWKIVGIAPLQEIMKDAHDIRQLIIISVGLSIIFVIALYFFITTRLTRPIRLLQSKMRLAASGYLEGKVQPVGMDEIADLGKSFNTMIEQIKLLLQQSIQKQRQIRKAELRTLQAQINPHFLYNTLDSIVWMAEAGKNKEVVQLVTAMSRFFRTSLSKGRDWITVRDELDHVRNYLIIQQTRYRDILDYDIKMDEALMDIPILKMTLQPLVENALYHGIKNQRGKGRIVITGHRVNRHEMVIEVHDNGAGIASESLDHLREQLAGRAMIVEEDGELHGFGLFNVQQRIRLFYGEEYGIHVHSTQGEGTTVTIHIPIQRGYSHEESISG